MAIELHHLHPSHDDEMTLLKARIAELEKENQTLAEDVSDKIESITELMELVEKYKSQKADLEEELQASKRKEKESRELADPYTLYCEASAESLRKALGEYRWHRPCDDRPPEWSCVIVFCINGSKCRTNRAKITDMAGHEILHSQYDNSFEYRLGQEIEIKDFNLMYNVECASGFHFFRTRKEADNY